MERGNYNDGIGGAGRGRGYGNRGGRGGYRDNRGGRGGYRDIRGGGGSGGRGENYPHQEHHQQGGQYHYQGGGRGGRGGVRGWGPTQIGGQQCGIGPDQTVQGGGAYRQEQKSGQSVGPTWVESSGAYGRGGAGAGGGGRGVWTGKPSFLLGESQTQAQSQRVPQQTLIDSVSSDIGSLEISERRPSLTLPESAEERVLPIKRPDNGGTLYVRSTRLFANHFPVRFSSESIIMHYDVDIKLDTSSSTRFPKKSIPKYERRLISDKLFSDDPTRFQEKMSAFDGEKNMFSAVPLPTGRYNVEIPRGEDTKGHSYIVTIKLVNELKLSKLKDYLAGELQHIPRDILQGMDLVMKDNPSRHRVSVGRSFYSKEFRVEDDLDHGIAAFRGFQQSLKPTSQGLALCLDYSVLAFRKQMPVIDFLMEHVWGFQRVNDVIRLSREVTNTLKGLKVTVTHRLTKQNYTIAGLTERNTRDLKFVLDDPEGKHPSREIGLVDYFREKYGKEIMHKDIPCLNLGKGNRKNYVPMEFCTLVEGQRYPKEHLDREAGLLLKKISLAPPKQRKNTIYEMVRAEDGPCGEVAANFGIAVEKNMTRVPSRVIGPPDLKLGNPSGNTSLIKVDGEKRQWNLVGKFLVEGKPIERWALIDFSSYDRYKLNAGNFVHNLRNRLRNLGVRMEEPVTCRFTSMRDLSSVNVIQQLLESVVKETNGKCKGQLQIIVCVMVKKDPGYKYLKWVSETQVGVLTQCCLASNANKGNDQTLANIALKINAKLGGSNVELMERLPRFEGKEHVMFVGADVNHPAPFNSACPSIAAVVATMNWPAANRYAARVCPQDHRKEKIMNFGTMCLDLVNTYARINKVKPNKIVVFRDGVSEGQFDMVLNEELLDMKKFMYEENYHPTITLVVAQKRHQTRLFLENERDGGASGNVPPGTVVDTIIVHPSEFDFYLCSHYGSLGTSKPTHYYVLWDEHNFTSDQLQKLIYNLCFTFARCTKPVSLVPPVYYADLVAYRGRLYQEVVMELQPSASVSSSSSGESSSTSAASLNESFYKLHPDLQNIMFFV